MQQFRFPDIPDAVFAFSDLREDFVYRHIPPRQRQEYLEGAMQIGAQQAAAYAGKDLSQIMAADGVQIRRFPEVSKVGIRSQICYDGKNRYVDIFTETAAQISAALAVTDCPLTQSQVEDLFLAHEFYHWLEYSSGIPTSQLCGPFRGKIFGLFPRTYQVRRTSEIAAFLFAKKWCGLPIHPKAIDYYLMSQAAADGATRAYAELEVLTEQYRSACLMF